MTGFLKGALIMDNRYLEQAEEIEKLKNELDDMEERAREWAVLNAELAKRLQLRDKQRLSYRRLVKRYKDKYGDINNG